jgi:HEPN domain-containing protein
MDVDKQVEYWATGSAEDLVAGETLLEKGYLRQGLFFVHLALEKTLKARVVRATRDVPPRVHNLVRLAQLAGLKTNNEQERFLRRFDLYQLEGRYPDSQQVVLDPGLARQELQTAMEVLQWLKAQLSTQ